MHKFISQKPKESLYKVDMTKEEKKIEPKRSAIAGNEWQRHMERSKMQVLVHQAEVVPEKVNTRGVLKRQRDPYAISDIEMDPRLNAVG
jgi:hypothetical protein